MTDRPAAPEGVTPEQVAAILKDVTPAPWLYRPDKHDDWGWVKAQGCVIAQVRHPDRIMDEELAEWRKAKQDPWEANARFVAWARNNVEALAADRDAQTARADALRRSYDELYADALADARSDAQEFDGDLWKLVRDYLTELNLDWSDYTEDGITAEQAIEHIRECMDGETARADAAEALIPRFPDHMAQIVAAKNITLPERLKTLVAAIEAIPEHMRQYQWQADPKQAFGSKWVRQVVGDNGRGMGRQAIAEVVGHLNVADFIAAANPDTISMLITDLAAQKARADALDEALNAMTHKWGQADRDLAAAEAKVARLVEMLLRFLPDYEPWMDEWPDDATASTYKRHTYGDHRAARAIIAEVQG